MTPSATDPRLAREDALVAGFTALAVAVHVLESAVPMPLPGIKPGLANLVVVVVLLRHGLGLAVWVALLRVLVASLATGTFLTPTFALSLAGALGSIGALALTDLLGRGRVGAIGYSAASATAHMAGQIALAACRRRFFCSGLIHCHWISMWPMSVFTHMSPIPIPAVQSNAWSRLRKTAWVSFHCVATLQ